MIQKNRMFNAVHCTDHLLGEFVDKLEKAGILNDTVLFIQADHGSFITPDIVRQFGSKVGDTRLLTLLALPDSVKLKPEELRKNEEGTNLDTVATLLDIMNIFTQH